MNRQDRGGWFVIYGSIAALCLLIASIVLACLWSPVANQTCDLGVYYKYSGLIAQGSGPYRDFTVEYPPLSLVLFQVPRWLGANSIPAYMCVFGLELLVVNAFLLVGVASVLSESLTGGDAGNRLIWYIGCLSAAGPLVFFRYDLAAGAIAFASVLWWRRGRTGAGGVLAAAGVFTKFFPALILLPAIADGGSLRSKLKGAAGFAVAMATGFLLWFLWAGSGVAATFAYHLRRGIQLESAYSGAIMLAAKLRPLAVSIGFQDGAYVLITPFSRAAGVVGLVLQLGLILVAVWRGGKIKAGLFQTSAAVILAFILGGKVLSPQFLIWLIPFMAVLEGSTGKRCRALLLLACALTTALYPFAYVQLLRFEWLPIGILNSRNAILFLILIQLLTKNEDSYPGGDSPDLRAASAPVLLATPDSGGRSLESRL